MSVGDAARDCVPGSYWRIMATWEFVLVADVVVVVVVAEVDADPFDGAGEPLSVGPYSVETGEAASLPTSAVSSIENMNGRCALASPCRSGCHQCGG